MGQGTTRSKEDKELIRSAVAKMMDAEMLTENGAYRRIQKAAMDQRETMVAVAQRYLDRGYIQNKPR